MLDIANPDDDGLDSRIHLVHGLHNERGQGEWRVLMTRIICGEWPPACGRRCSTVEAEAGLGIDGGPCYFYVMRADEQYGLVIFLLTEADDAEWPADVYGATPFDSGGWWRGKIETIPCLDRTTRCDRFKAVDVPLQKWQSAFNYHVANNTTMLSYVTGTPPAEHAPAVAEIILATAQNSAKAWTWEVRIPPSLIADRVQLHSAYMASEDRDEYIDWVEDNVPLDERPRIRQWVDDSIHPVPASAGAGGSEVAKFVNGKLVEWAGGSHGG